jgi:hypothetical protein
LSLRFQIFIAIIIDYCDAFEQICQMKYGTPLIFEFSTNIHTWDVLIY